MANNLTQQNNFTLWSDHIAPSTNQNNLFSNSQAQDSQAQANGLNPIIEEVKTSETDVFALDLVQFEPPDEIITCSVSNNILCLGLKNSKILLIDLLRADDVLELALPRGTASFKSFLDPTGEHLFISTEEGNNYYYHKFLGQFKPLNKLSGVQISSVAWDKTVPDGASYTGAILLGTKDGKIYEASINPSEDHFKSKEDKWLNLVYTLSEPSPISGLHVEAFPATPNQSLVLFSTLTRLYQFIGPTAASSTQFKLKLGHSDEGKFQSLFKLYETNPSFQEIPGQLTHSQMICLAPFGDKDNRSLCDSFVWMTGSGLYFGDLIFGSQEPGDSVIDNVKLTAYPDNKIPISIGMTQFHFLLLYSDRIMALSRLNQKLVYNQMIPKKRTASSNAQAAIELTIDAASKTYWIHTPSSIFELIASQEDRNVWSFYLEMKQFDDALIYAKTIPQKNQILVAQADHYFSTGRYQLAAKSYGTSIAPLEEVSLKFLEKQENDALRTYLTYKLEKFKKKDTIQLTLVSMWLIELYLSRIGELEDLAAAAIDMEARQAKPPVHPSIDEVMESESKSSQYLVEEGDLLVEEFRAFLGKWYKVFDIKTAYQLLNSHGRNQEVLHLAAAAGDHLKVIHHHLLHNNYDQALSALSKLEDPKLIYKFSPAIIEHCPTNLVTLWMRHPKLEPRLLIPALLKYKGPSSHEGSEGGNSNQAIRYLQYVVTKLHSKDPIVHNFLLTLLVRQSESVEDESQLIQFLTVDSAVRFYSLDYALRLCSQHKRSQAKGIVYGLLGLYPEAVDLALSLDDLQLAKIAADKAESHPELRKELWLKIAKYVIVNQGKIKEAITLLGECELLKIEDLLPYFPDFVLIDDFKEEICNALEEYSINIDDLKSEMDETTLSAQTIRQNLQLHKSKFNLISPQEACNLCFTPVLTRQFYLFPCHHSFHSDCLVKKVSSQFSQKEKKRLSELQSQLSKEVSLLRSDMSKRHSLPPSNNYAGALTQANGNGGVDRKDRLEGLKNEFDELIAQECPLCGDMMIRSIGVPFIQDGQTNEDWSI